MSNSNHDSIRLSAIEPFAWVYNDSNSWFWPSLLTIAATSLFLMYLLCRSCPPPPASSSFAYKYFISPTLTMLYVIFSACWLIFFISLASSTICDPLVTVHNTNTDTHELWPHSEIDNMDQENFPQDINPEARGVCLAQTPYTYRGQQLVTIAVALCVLSYTFFLLYITYVQGNNNSNTTTTTKHKVSFTQIIGMNVVFTFSLGLAIQIILDNDQWDWRVFSALLWSFLVSSFCITSIVFYSTSSSTVTTPASAVSSASSTDNNSQQPWIYSFIWIYIRFLYELEQATCAIIIKPYSINLPS